MWITLRPPWFHNQPFKWTTNKPFSDHLWRVCSSLLVGHFWGSRFICCVCMCTKILIHWSETTWSSETDQVWTYPLCSFFIHTEPYNIKATICVFPWLKDEWYSTGLMQVILKRFCRKIFMFAETQRKISLQESNIWHNPKHETRTKC